MAKKQTAKRTVTGRARAFASPNTVTLPDMLAGGNDLKFRETLYLMALAFGRLHSCREEFGRALSLTASQFIVLIGTAHRQGREGVTIRGLADHTQLAATHVTTEVGRLIGKGLLTKQANARDRRSVWNQVEAANRRTSLLNCQPQFAKDARDRTRICSWEFQYGLKVQPGDGAAIASGMPVGS